MHKTLLAAFIGASVFAVPAFAQVIPGAAGQAGAHSSSQAGTTLPGANANASTAIGAGAGAGTGTSATTSATRSTTGTQPLGLGGLLKQTQAADPATDGAGPTGGLNAKARAKAAMHGH